MEITIKVRLEDMLTFASMMLDAKRAINEDREKWKKLGAPYTTVETDKTLLKYEGFYVRIEKEFYRSFKTLRNGEQTMSVDELIGRIADITICEDNISVDELKAIYYYLSEYKKLKINVQNDEEGKIK